MTKQELAKIIKEKRVPIWLPASLFVYLQGK